MPITDSILITISAVALILSSELSATLFRRFDATSVIEAACALRLLTNVSDTVVVGISAISAVALILSSDLSAILFGRFDATVI